MFSRTDVCLNNIAGCIPDTRGEVQSPRPCTQRAPRHLSSTSSCPRPGAGTPHHFAMGYFHFGVSKVGISAPAAGGLIPPGQVAPQRHAARTDLLGRCHRCGFWLYTLIFGCVLRNTVFRNNHGFLSLPSARKCSILGSEQTASPASPQEAKCPRSQEGSQTSPRATLCHQHKGTSTHSPSVLVKHSTGHFTEPLRLEKTSKIRPNHPLPPVPPTKPCP